VKIVFMLKGLHICQESGIRELQKRGCEVMAVFPRAVADFEYDPWQLDGVEAIQWDPEREPSADELLQRVRQFTPDVLVVASWDGPKAYRAVMKAQPNGALRVLQMSNFWRNTAKQWVGRAVHRAYLRPYYDYALVPGDRAEWFANRIGFPAEHIIRGMWAAETDVFGAFERSGEEIWSRRSFIAVQRLVEHKGADILAAAYRQYRTLVEDPWQLHVVGKGDMAPLFDDLDGASMHGFVQPRDLAKMMAQSSCFVLPSREEYWGISVHEAAAAGLPIITTDQVGAHATFVQDGYNGWVVPSGNVDALVERMVTMSALSAVRLGEMSEVSKHVAARLNPGGWARNLHEEFTRITGR
jgi:glycosyltransferase involved in cell wall biosynthesis